MTRCHRDPPARPRSSAGRLAPSRGASFHRVTGGTNTFPDDCRHGPPSGWSPLTRGPLGLDAITSRWDGHGRQYLRSRCSGCAAVAAATGSSAARRPGLDRCGTATPSRVGTARRRGVRARIDLGTVLLTVPEPLSMSRQVGRCLYSSSAIPHPRERSLNRRCPHEHRRQQQALHQHQQPAVPRWIRSPGPDRTTK